MAAKSLDLAISASLKYERLLCRLETRISSTVTMHMHSRESCYRWFYSQLIRLHCCIALVLS